MIMAASTILEDVNTGKLGRQFWYFKAKVLQDHKADGTDNTFQEAIDDEQTIVFTDKSTSYVNIAHYVEIHYEWKIKWTDHKRNT